MRARSIVLLLLAVLALAGGCWLTRPGPDRPAAPSPAAPEGPSRAVPPEQLSEEERLFPYRVLNPTFRETRLVPGGLPASLEQLPLPRRLGPEDYSHLSDSTRRYFDQEGLLNPNRDHTLLPLRVMETMGLRPGHAIADIGCGSGYFTYRFSPAVGQTGAVYAVDINTQALRYVDAVFRRSARPELSNIVLVLSTPDDVRLGEGSVDLAFLCDMHYLNFGYMHGDPATVEGEMARDPVGFIAGGAAPSLASIRRALRPGGRMVYIEGRKELTPESDLDAEQIVAVVE